jgi:sugar/nucleoside kinase (ribokinase family)
MRDVLVCGPAYLDRILRVDSPLRDPQLGPPVDGSVDGLLEPGEGLRLVDPTGARIEVQPPKDWPGPWGVVRLSRGLSNGRDDDETKVCGEAWLDDLGGMGAGFASALGGTLVSALGSEDDEISRKVIQFLSGYGIAHLPVRVRDQSADWTLLVSSGRFGDKLAIGFRGCHAELRHMGDLRVHSPAILVVAGLPNRIAAEILAASRASIRVFAPSLRNMIDTNVPITTFTQAIHVLFCNRSEWLAQADRESVANVVPVVAVTDGAKGSSVRFRVKAGSVANITVPAFPREEPPADTNRAGEAYAATMLSTMLDGGWEGGGVDHELVEFATRRASAAAALVLDRLGFGFPSQDEIDNALHDGCVRPHSKTRSIRGVQFRGSRVK